MDVLKQNKIIELHRVKCVHNVPVRTQYGVTQVVVFLDEATGNVYAWKTSTSSALGFVVNNYYSIRAKLNPDTNMLTFVEELFREDSPAVESEQPDAVDVIFGRAKYDK